MGINERTQKLREAVTKYSTENQKLETNCIMRKRQLQELQKRFRNFIADYNYNQWFSEAFKLNDEYK